MLEPLLTLASGAADRQAGLDSRAYAPGLISNARSTSLEHPLRVALLLIAAGSKAAARSPGIYSHALGTYARTLRSNGTPRDPPGDPSP